MHTRCKLFNCKGLNACITIFTGSHDIHGLLLVGSSGRQAPAASAPAGDKRWWGFCSTWNSARARIGALGQPARRRERNLVALAATRARTLAEAECEIAFRNFEVSGELDSIADVRLERRGLRRPDRKPFVARHEHFRDG